MIRIPIPDGVNVETKLLLNLMMDMAAPLCIVLDSAPTTANELLKEGERGLYGGFLYETVNGTTYKYGTAV